MYHNIEIDWNSFEYIFSGRTQYVFEQLAYILFCVEFNQDVGVFRYFNQAGIETEPILYEKDIIGFQAKYYDASTKIGDRVSDFEDMIDKTKRKNPTVTKIYIFTNKELSESSLKEKKKPKYQEDIELYAKEQNVTIEWRVPSHIERVLFSSNTPPFIRDFFFNPQKGIRKFIIQMKLHTESLTNAINNSIVNKGKDMLIENQDDVFTGFIKSKKKHLIIHGYSGTGKSGMIKSFINANSTEMPIFLFKATDFSFNSLSEFTRQFGDCYINDFLNAFNSCEHKIIIIDSAEKRFSMTQTILDEFLSIASDHGWKVVHTIRSSYKDNYINFVLKTTECKEYQLRLIQFGIIKNFLIKCDIPYPTNIKMQDLICNLFYLNLYISTFSKNPDSFQTRSLFLTYIWNSRIKGIPHDTEANAIAREQLAFNMFKSILKKNSYYYFNESNNDSTLLQNLRDDEVIDYDDVYKGYFFTHDIYEELVARHLINFEYCSTGDEIEFHNSLDISMPMRKHYRLWLHDRIYEDDKNELNRFIIKSVANKLINKIWKDELFIALMDNEKNSEALLLLDDLFNENPELFTRSVFLLNTACKVINYDSASMLLTQKEQDAKNNLLYRFTKPSGVGWEYLIEYIYKNSSGIKWNPAFIQQVYDMIASWIKFVKHGDTTKHAGLIALYLYNLFENDEIKYQADISLKKDLSIIILEASFEIKEELLMIFNHILEEGIINRRNIYYDLIDGLLGNTLNSIVPSQSMPKTVIKLCELFWKEPKESKLDNPFFSSHDTVEIAFGLKSNTNHAYYPTSALKTPIFMLLQYSFKDGMDFILDFINSATEDYEKSKMNQDYMETCSVTLTLSNNTEINQISSDRLWMLHRGGATGPGLLECILMALEKWLLNNIPHMNSEQANEICEYILQNSKSIATTSVINSVVLAYPEKLFITACYLLSLGEVVFSLDQQRLVKESSANFLRGFPHKNQYDQERIETNNLPFRKTSLEEVISSYQLSSKEITPEQYTNRMNQLYSCIDNLSRKVTPENITLRYALNRIDLRRMKPNLESTVIKDDKEYIVFEVDEDEDLKSLRKENQKQTEDYYQFLNVSLWAREKFDGENDKEQKYKYYEDNPIKAFDEMKLIIENMEKGKIYDYLTTSSPIYIAACLLRFYKARLTIEQKEYCKQILLTNLHILTNVNRINDLTNGTPILIDSMPYLIKNTNNREERLNLDIVFLFALFSDFSQERSFYQKFSNTMWRDCPHDAEAVFKMFVLLKSDFVKWNKLNSDSSMEKFIKKKRRVISRIYKGTLKMEDLDYSLLDHDDLLSATMLLDINSEQHWKIIKQIAPPIWEDIFNENYKRGYERNTNYHLEASYIQWLSKYTYNTTDIIRKDLIETLEPYFKLSRNMESFLSNILSEHDTQNDNRVFWKIWNRLYNSIIILCNPYKEIVLKDKEYYDLDGVVSTYCFAWPYWGEKQREWIGVKLQHLSFFDKIVEDAGFLPITLYSVTRFINSIGYSFVKEGIKWISKIISENDHLTHSQLQINTIYYLEEIVLRVSKEHADDAKRNPSFRVEFLCVLNFLVSRGSTVGFFIREEFY